MNAVATIARPAIWKWGLVALLAIAALWAVDRFANRDPAPSAQESLDSPYSGKGPPRSYSEALARSDVAITNARAAATVNADQWLMHEILASEYLARAQLSGSYEDYAAAQRALDAAFEVAVERSGPHMMRASLDFSMHRLPEAERMLAAMDAYAVPPDPGERAEMAAMRGDIAFYSGRYQAALDKYDEADALIPGAASFRRAIYAARTGDIDKADTYFAEAERAYRAPTAQTRAYMQLQRGILDLDRGRLGDAMKHFRSADSIFPGRWLIEEHIAEVLTLQGKTVEAEKLYRDIVRRTGHPEFIDALAGIAETRGDPAAARRLYDQAWAAWVRRLKLFPQATYGHAIDHCVARKDWPCALELARRNHDARPYGEAKIALARALLGNSRVEEARAMIETVLASRWRTAALHRTADLHRTAADIYEASGMTDKAAAQDKLAKAINPLA